MELNRFVDGVSECGTTKFQVHALRFTTYRIPLLSTAVADPKVLLGHKDRRGAVLILPFTPFRATAGQHYKSAKGIWRAALGKAGVSHFRIYNPRSTYATRLSAGV